MKKEKKLMDNNATKSIFIYKRLNSVLCTCPHEPIISLVKGIFFFIPFNSALWPPLSFISPLLILFLSLVDKIVRRRGIHCNTPSDDAKKYDFPSALHFIYLFLLEREGKPSVEISTECKSIGSFSNKRGYGYSIAQTNKRARFKASILHIVNSLAEMNIPNRCNGNEVVQRNRTQCSHCAKSHGELLFSTVEPIWWWYLPATKKKKENRALISRDSW